MKNSKTPEVIKQIITRKNDLLKHIASGKPISELKKGKYNFKTPI